MVQKNMKCEKNHIEMSVPSIEKAKKAWKKWRCNRNVRETRRLTWREIFILYVGDGGSSKTSLNRNFVVKMSELQKKELHSSRSEIDECATL